MNCDAYRILVAGYIDGELSEKETRSLKAHLQTCETCVHYLERQEALQTSLKRYALYQEAPSIPDNFAAKVAERIKEETLTSERTVPFRERVKALYHRAVFQFIEGWIRSLKTHPFSWATSASGICAVFVAVVMFQVAQWTPAPSSSLVAVVQEESARESTEMLPLGEEFGDSLIHFDETDMGTESANNSANELEQPLIEVAEEPFVQVAQKGSGTVDEYVYSHVTEVYQDRLIDDVMFVGYVQ